MLYRENGQFKTSYRADSQVFPILQDRIAIGLLLAVAFIAVPLFAGFDLETGSGRIFSYDATGGRYEEHNFFSVGSGSTFARGSLKKLYRQDLSETDAISACIQALYDAADDDSATGGPDLTRRIYPVVAVVTGDGFRRAADTEVGPLVEAVVSARMSAPDGPNAPLH